LTRWVTIGALRRAVLFLTAILWILPPAPARSHDPGAWGGLFRSRDQGATWVSANRGPFLSGALALTISPTDANHLLLGTESGLFRSRNGGRDWVIEAASLMLGPVFALAFAADGERALASTGSRILLGETLGAWRQVAAPEGATPARAIVRGNEPGRFYLAGRTGLYRSDDWGGSWSNAANGLPREPATVLLVAQGTPQTIYAVVQGRMWASVDGAGSWRPRGVGSIPAGMDALTVDARHPATLWAAGGDRLFRSDDDGAHWQSVGLALPEPITNVNGIAVSNETIVVATDRGLYRSVDGGKNWTPLSDTLPAHLEAGLLLRDPADPALLYAGFTLIPYAELWRRAANPGEARGLIDTSSLMGGVALLLVLAGAAGVAVRQLSRYYRPSAQSALLMRSGTSRERGTLP
jgi:photosystem II stability/assembly factor-like uncharacterized protein